MPVYGGEYEQAEKRAHDMLISLGYEYHYGPEISPNGKHPERATYYDVVLEDRLRRAIKRINTWGISDENVRKAVREITHVRATNFVEANHQIHNKLVNMISVQQDLGAGKKGQTVQFFDFQNPENNDFLVVNQFEVRGPHQRAILDVVLFVNGIPLVVVEFKGATTRNARQKAIKDLYDYQESVPALFQTNHVMVAAWGSGAVMAPIGAPARFFHEWKDPWPATADDIESLTGEQPSTQDYLLHTMFHPARILEFLRFFTAYKKTSSGLTKMVARYQQYRAVEKAMERIRNAKRPKERGGVIWHTQGSGKSLTMLLLGLKLRVLPDTNSTLVLVTDRQQLDDQITATFENCGFPNPEQATTGKELREMLTLGSGRTIATLVQKFQSDEEKYPVLDRSEGIYVLVDEAHRTQYKLLAMNMRRALPNACFIAFTGTPIAKDDRHTVREFGDYIDTYTIDQSIADGATLPIFYQAELTELFVEGQTLDELFDETFSDRSPEEAAEIKKRYVTEREVALAPTRIRRIAEHIVNHYRKYVEPNGFKAQVVTRSREAAKLYQDAIQQVDGAPETAVIISPENTKGALEDFELAPGEEQRLVSRFKKEDDPLKMLIVCDKLLTGFDAPILQVMYLDKPLQGHNLLQAIARVNRPYPEKRHGLIVDYYGVSESLKEALAMFTTEQVQSAMLPFHELRNRLAETHRAAMGFFSKANISELEECVAVLEPEDVRVQFRKAFREFARVMDIVLPNTIAAPYVEDFKRLGEIYRAARNRYYDDEYDLQDTGEKVRQLINDHLKSRGVKQLSGPISIMNDRFDEELENLSSARARASQMEHAIRQHIAVHLKEDPVYYQSLKERLEALIERQHEKQLAAMQLVLELSKVMNAARGVEKAARKLGLDTVEFACYNLLGDSLPDEKDQELANLARAIVEAVRKRQVIDWQSNPITQKRVRRGIDLALLKYGLRDKTRRQSLTSKLASLAQERL